MLVVSDDCRAICGEGDDYREWGIERGGVVIGRDEDALNGERERERAVISITANQIPEFRLKER